MKSMMVLMVLFVVGCGKGGGVVPPPVPPVETKFQVVGKHLTIAGELKAGAKISVLQAKAAVDVAVRMLESK